MERSSAMPAGLLEAQVEDVPGAEGLQSGGGAHHQAAELVDRLTSAQDIGLFVDHHPKWTANRGAPAEVFVVHLAVVADF